MKTYRTLSPRVGGLLLALAVALFLAGPTWAQFGHTQGGYGGAALGAIGGATAGSALIAAAGIANPLLSGTLLAASTLGAGYVGARMGSKVGNTFDSRIDPKTMWTFVGAVSGSLMGFMFGPAGGIVGKVLFTGLGAALGGIAGNYLAGNANKDYNARTIGALIGGVNGALIGGPVGAAVGVPLGYIAGDQLEKHVFSKDTLGFDRGWRYGGYYGDQDQYGLIGKGGKLWDFDKRHGYYPPDPYQQGQSGPYYDGSGFDRTGYDRLGYDKHGYDREGYDKFGYDKFGYDRDGYNRKGYKRDGSYSAVKGQSTTYDPKTYNDYWQAWGQVGGDYPQLTQDHFKYFPDQVKSVAYDRYASNTGLSPASADSDLVALKQEYLKQVETVQGLSGKGVSAAEQDAALKRLQELEAQLKSKVGQEVGGK
ncbi:MAG: hypothetical protein HY815_17635 [Candidatus Riflebacteria bacterium]|nr:hypothetical protein [Candidatus Riflebacteria bacterium]